MWVKRSLIVSFLAACALMMSGCHALFGAFLTGLTGEVPPGFSDGHEEDECIVSGACGTPIIAPSIAYVTVSNSTPRAGQPVTLAATSTPPAIGTITWDVNNDGQFGGPGDPAPGNPVTVSFPTEGTYVVIARVPIPGGSVQGRGMVEVVEDETTPTPAECTQLGVDLTRSPAPSDPPPPPYTANYTVSEANRDGAPVAATFDWDFETDRTVDATTTQPGSMLHTYPTPGPYTATVIATASDGSGDCGADSLVVSFPATPGPPRLVPPGSMAGPLAAPAPRFSVRLSGGSLDAGRLSKSRKRLVLRGAIGLGTFKARISGSPATVATGTAIAGASLRINRDTGNRALSGALVAQLDGIAGATCVTYRLRAPADEPLHGGLKILGGPGDAGALTGRGRVGDGRVKGNGPAQSLRLRGTIHTHPSEPTELAGRCAKLQARVLQG